jgi:hypothetical protein
MRYQLVEISILLLHLLADSVPMPVGRKPRRRQSLGASVFRNDEVSFVCTSMAQTGKCQIRILRIQDCKMLSESRLRDLLAIVSFSELKANFFFQLVELRIIQHKLARIA